MAGQILSGPAPGRPAASPAGSRRLRSPVARRLEPPRSPARLRPLKTRSQIGEAKGTRPSAPSSGSSTARETPARRAGRTPNTAAKVRIRITVGRVIAAGWRDGHGARRLAKYQPAISLCRSLRPRPFGHQRSRAVAVRIIESRFGLTRAESAIWLPPPPQKANRNDDGQHDHECRGHCRRGATLDPMSGNEIDRPPGSSRGPNSALPQ